MSKKGEMRFWQEITPWGILALIATFFPIFDIPVFWPLLLVYLLYMFWIVIKRQRDHMKRYNYSFSDFFKKTEEKK